MNRAPAFTTAPAGFYVSASRIPGIGKQPDRIMLTWSRLAPGERHSKIVDDRFVKETTALVAADAGGLPGREVSSQTIGDLEILGIGLRVGPRVALVDRVELNHVETPS